MKIDAQRQKAVMVQRLARLSNKRKICGYIPGSGVTDFCAKYITHVNFQKSNTLWVFK